MPEAVEGDLRFRVHDESVMQVWDQIRADCEGDEYRGASHPRDVFENLVGEIESEYHDIIRNLRAALSRAEARATLAEGGLPGLIFSKRKALVEHCAQIVEGFATEDLEDIDYSPNQTVKLIAAKVREAGLSRTD